MAKIKLVLCDDQKEILDYLCNLLETQPDFEVVGTAHSGKDVIGVVEEKILISFLWIFRWKRKPPALKLLI